MKKLFSILMLVLVVSFCAYAQPLSTTQVFEITSTVPEVEPVYALELINIERGMAFRIGLTEYRIFKLLNAKDTLASFSIKQENIARWNYPVTISISSTSGEITKLKENSNRVRIERIDGKSVNLYVMNEGTMIPWILVSLTYLTDADESSVRITYQMN